MKILSIYSEFPNQGLNEIMQVIYSTLAELNVELEIINLKDNLEFYEGIKSNKAEQIILKMQQADACILATSVNLFAPTAVMKSFLEHCNHIDYNNMLLGKNYMSVVVSSTMGEREASEYLYRVISILGGFELEKIAIGGRDLSSLNIDSYVKENIEKVTEDFYRTLRQNRRVFSSTEAYIYRTYCNNPIPEISKPQPSPVYTEPEPIKTIPKQDDDFNEIKVLLDNIKNKANKNTVEKKETKTEIVEDIKPFVPTEIYTQVDTTPKETKVEAYEAQFEAFEERQQEDTKDINKILLQSPDTQLQIQKPVIYEKPPIAPPQEVVYREKTCKQMLLSLPHHFQSHLASDLNAVFQFTISGEENFDGYLIIQNSETSFEEGTTPKPDIYIYTSSTVMKDILRGKYSTQKAFMTGQLKVRGNFVLLNKLDQLYKKM